MFFCSCHCKSFCVYPQNCRILLKIFLFLDLNCKIYLLYVYKHKKRKCSDIYIKLIFELRARIQTVAFELRSPGRAVEQYVHDSFLLSFIASCQVQLIKSVNCRRQTGYLEKRVNEGKFLNSKQNTFKDLIKHSL